MKGVKYFLLALAAVVADMWLIWAILGSFLFFIFVVIA